MIHCFTARPAGAAHEVSELSALLEACDDGALQGVSNAGATLCSVKKPESGSWTPELKAITGNRYADNRKRKQKQLQNMNYGTYT